MAVTTNLGITQLTEGQSQKEITINTAFDTLDKAIAGKLTKSVAGAVDVTLTPAEWIYAMYEFTGNTTTNINIIVPVATKRFSVLNATTGPPRTITIKTATGTGVVLTEGEHMVLEQNGDVMIALTSATGAGGGSTTLLDLTDTPDTYTAQASKVLAVKVDETGTEFVTPAGGDSYWSRTDLGTSSLATDLLAFWNLEEASGNRVDSVGTNPLVPQGTVATITNASGKIDQALAMNGTAGTYLSVADNATFSAAPNLSVTVACWVYIASTSNMGFVGKGSAAVSSNNVEYLLWHFGTQWCFEVGSGSSFVNLASPTVPVLNTWTLLIGWYDHVADLQYIQVNNGTPTQVANTVGSYDSTSPFEVGRTVGHGTQSLNGRVDLVAFAKRVWTAQERTDFWNNGNGLAPPFTLPSRLSPATLTDQLLLAASATTQERLEIDSGIKVGNSTGTVDGIIRWTGTDLEVRKAGAWVSLTL